VINDLIDCDGFEDGGTSSALDCWKHQSHMLAAEIGELQNQLVLARTNIQSLVRMHTEVTRHRDALALEVVRLEWLVGDNFRKKISATKRPHKSD
jgi:hypothetical protein